MMAPKQPPLRLLREMRTLATALDEIAAGRYQFAADVLAQRIKALELFQSDGTWNRAQYLELLDVEGPSLLGRGRGRDGVEGVGRRTQDAPAPVEGLREDRTERRPQRRGTDGAKRREGPEEGQRRQRQGQRARRVGEEPAKAEASRSQPAAQRRSAASAACWPMSSQRRHR